MLPEDRKAWLMKKGKRVFARRLRRRMTVAEKILWKALRDRRFQSLKFRRQVPLGSFVADFLCSQHRLIIEVDGDSHTDRKEYDEWRTERLNEQNYIILRVSNEEVMNNLPLRHDMNVAMVLGKEHRHTRR